MSKLQGRPLLPIAANSPAQNQIALQGGTCFLIIPPMATVITLLLVGAALLVVEFFLPGMVAGILGTLCLVAAVVIGYVQFGPRQGTFILLGVMLGLTLGTFFWIAYFPQSRVAQSFVSKKIIRDTGVGKSELLGQTGIARTDLRPSGSAEINGKRFDVVSEGSMIERGAQVQVVDVEGIRIVVRAI
jgi:membrane-bound serine protease (ClpP class)